jgi:mono/diheme cytochrome c family protein
MTTPTLLPSTTDKRRRAQWRRWTLVALAVVALAALGLVYDRLFRERAAPYFESDAEHFLYGSIGAESIDGVPYWIWLVLPRIFPDLLPGGGGYSSLGLVSEGAHELPVGLSMVTIGYPRVAMNCAFCHTGSVRSRPDEPPGIVAGAPAHQTSAQAYTRFLTTAAADPRFNAGTILGEISRNYRLSLVDRLLYRFVVIPGTRQRLLRLRSETAWTNRHPDWGAGRADILNPIKFRRLGRSVDATIGTADMMPLWSTASRTHGLFWDGSTSSLRDAVMTSALGTGVSRPWLDRDIARWDESGNERSSLRRIHDYMSALKAPPYPFPIDGPLASAGEAVYKAQCVECHADAGAGGGDVASVSSAGTDDNRRTVWTADATTAYDTFSAGRAWQSPAVAVRDGYLAVPLDGLWLRAPYLHNGSVPSLTDLLNAPQGRPSRFWRGYDVYDPAKVGFISDGPEAQRLGTVYDTTRPGNANTGHSYGSDLPADSKRALLEYLKTL